MNFWKIYMARHPEAEGSGGSNPELDKLQSIDVQDYIDQIKNLKENTVSKEEYEKVQDEKKKLLQALVDGENIEKEADEASKKTDKEIMQAARDVILGNGDSNHTNLEIAEAAVNLYEKELAHGKNIFLPNSPKYQVNEIDQNGAEKVYQALKHCVEYADGDPGNFQAEFNRLVVEDPRAAFLKRR